MSVFRESLVFFDQIGLYDVVLPFLLVFTLVFGTLEKSRMFGTEKNGDKMATRKNLNAMIAFCVGFFVVASAQLVSLINIFVSRVALILVILIMFMMLIGAMHKQQDNDGFNLFSAHRKVFYVIMALVGISMVLIFLDGVGWLTPLWIYVTQNWNSQLMSTIILFGAVAGLILFITRSPDGETKKS